ncbi:MAG: HEAT repeat domain-containing protein [Actinomycetia bacterium]|nr:HEAT repeat domain-containing protein [Actinomycetes bacterium]
MAIVEYASVLVDALPILEGGRFGSDRRSNDLEGRVTAVLGQPLSRSAVDVGVSSSQQTTRRACVRLLAESVPEVGLLERAVSTGDIVAIATAARALSTSGEVNRETGEVLLGSPLARFRSEGLWRLTKDDVPESETLVRAALNDRARSVRDVAQRWLLRHGQDPSEHYRSILPIDPRSGLSGLADRPDRADVGIARRYSNDESSAVRAAALRLLAGVGDRSDEPLLVDRFIHGTGTERRRAIAGLRRIGASDAVGQVWDLAHAGNDPRLAERVIYQLLPLTNRWQRIDIGLQAMASQDQTIRGLGLESLHRTLAGWNSDYAVHAPRSEALLDDYRRVRPILAREWRNQNQRYLLRSLDALLGLSDPEPDDGFLVCYDYGMGGLWRLMTAPSPEQILDRYPMLHVWRKGTHPAWIDDDEMRAIASDGVVDIDDETSAFLEAPLGELRDDNPNRHRGGLHG